ncbi:helix-turn-helix domain-containing protein [Enterocloster bolteae]|jgi:transcriptional regulator with XRE-family HTH domain|uniref:helix-turn-helix domain-containing protein n=1 Tax=Enterocloster bolteae TaxID=208479 RepID=UPI00263921CA|nr:helix-turn-helix transcriptional regulator [Enterocloster bolteae]
MGKSMFTIKGNICSERVRLGRALQKPPITQDELAKKLQFMGMEDMTTLIISRIEKNQRHVCDAELRMLAKALGVTMEWLVGDSDDIKLK